MTNQKMTKRALVLSVLALVMCVAMLVGTTFAWFTDTASTGVNRIQAGNLDVKLMYSTDMVTWKEATEQTKLFNDGVLWEPGHTEVAYLKVVNAGNLALKYNVATNFYQLERGKSAAGFFYIDKYLKIGIAETDAVFADRNAAIAAVDGDAKTLAKETQISKDWTVLKPEEESKPFAVVLYMPTTVGNEANNVQSWRNPKVEGLGLVVNATQAVEEFDSFGNTYDEDASTIMSSVSFSSGVHEINENIQAHSSMGVVQAEGDAQLIINADVYAEYFNGAAMAVQAGGNSKIVINGGDFRQVDVPASDPVCDLIYATGSATIEINGGTFKAVQPDRTLNVLDSDRGKAQIIVKGGSFYQYDPSQPTLGDNEVVVPDGYEVVQNGEWYTVVAK